MTSNAQTQPQESESQLPQVNCHSQIRLKKEGDKLLIILPSEVQAATATDWLELCQELKQRLNSSDRAQQSRQDAHLVAQDRLLDGRQMRTIAQILAESNFELLLVYTNRRQTAVAAATAGYSVQQQLPKLSGLSPTEPLSEQSEPLYLQTPVRSGREIRHPGTVVIWGDINPGGVVIATGDILVWGSLRGVAHAGVSGNRKCKIAALRMEPTQLRIAEIVARAPETPPEQLEPEVAYVTNTGIRIAKAINFAKTHSFSSEAKSWLDS